MPFWFDQARTTEDGDRPSHVLVNRIRCAVMFVRIQPAGPDENLSRLCEHSAPQVLRDPYLVRLTGLPVGNIRPIGSQDCICAKGQDVVDA